jgi:hypothetical protein
MRVPNNDGLPPQVEHIVVQRSIRFLVFLKDEPKYTNVTNMEFRTEILARDLHYLSRLPNLKRLLLSRVQYLVACSMTITNDLFRRCLRCRLR